ncbi:hypothetical protein BGX34_011751 [Mortierella sp. NVP85]|nr:hypothetical protein BGX34_011751 [Mortierella sp. NVP85]
MSTSLAHAVDPHSEAHQVSDGPASGHEQAVGSGLVTGTDTATSTNTGAPSSVDTDSKQGTAQLSSGTGPFQGDGADPSQPERLIPQSPMGWVAYTVSLNYNRLATSVLSPLTHWRWFDRIPSSCLILGAVPSQHLLSQLQQTESVSNIVNMCGEFQGHLETMTTLGLVQCWIPTPDFTVPTLDSIWVGIHFIAKCQARWQESDGSQQGLVYIHCKAGRGRSATVALCWLVYFYNLTAQEAQQVLLKARPQASVDKHIYLHPEVVSFYEQVQEQERNNTITRVAWSGSD